MLTTLLDLLSFKQFGLGGEETFRALEKAYRLGLEPTSLVRRLLDEGKKLDDIESFLEIQVEKIAPWPVEQEEAWREEEMALFSTWTPFLPLLGSFSINNDPKKTIRWWLKRNNLGYITGICPIFMLMTPEYDEETLTQLINLGYGTKFTPEDLNEISSQMIRKYVDESLLR
jgi:hypothetical protein